MFTTYTPGNGKSRCLPVENDMTNIQGSVFAMDDESLEHRIVEDCNHEENARACINDWAQVLS